MVFGSVNTLLLITWRFETASTPRKRKIDILVPFLSMLPYSSRVSLTGEEEEEERRRKKITIFDFFKFIFSASKKLSRN